jgi:hypothetical protein
MVFGHHIDPGLEIGHPLRRHVGDRFKADLLNGIFGFLLLLQIIHTYPEQQQQVTLQQESQPFIIMTLVITFQEFLIG